MAIRRLGKWVTIALAALVVLDVGTRLLTPIPTHAVLVSMPNPHVTRGSRGLRESSRQLEPNAQALWQPSNRPNEFAADDAVVQKAADDFAVDKPPALQFAQDFGDLSARFSTESSTEQGTNLRLAVLNRLSRDTAATPTAIQLDCRQTICRLQLTAPEADKSRIMNEIKVAGAFQQTVGMERPNNDGTILSDVYLRMP